MKHLKKIIVTSILFPFASVSAQAATAFTPFGGRMFTMDIPLLGSYQVSERTLLAAGNLIGALFFIGVLLGTFLLFWSVLARFRTVARDKAFAFGLNSTRNGLPFFVGMTLLFLLVVFLPSLSERVIRVAAPQFWYILGSNVWYGRINAVLEFLFYSYASAGVTAIALAYAKDGKRSFRAFIIKPIRYLHFLIAHVLYTVGLIIGSILLLFPAAWFGSKFFFWPYLILEEGIPFWEAFKRSAVMTRGAKKEIFLFWYLTVAIIFLGMALLGIGYLIAFPITIIASAYVYRAFAHPQNQTVATQKEAK